MVNIPRPKSSPSSFGANVEDLVFPENPYRSSGNVNFTFPNYSMPPERLSNVYYGHEYRQDMQQSIAMHSSPAMRQGSVIASPPNPQAHSQLNVLKRMHDENLEYGGQRRKRVHSTVEQPAELTEDETLLLKLKEEENLPWKDIAARFQSELGKAYQVPALQMRYKRLRERMRTWTEADVSDEDRSLWDWSNMNGRFMLSSKRLIIGKSINSKSSQQRYVFPFHQELHHPTHTNHNNHYLHPDARLRRNRALARQILSPQMG